MSAARQTAAGGLKILTDVGPIALFMIVYNIAYRSRPDDAIFIATAVFIVATLAALAFTWFRERRLSPMLLVTAVIVTVFGGLTLALQDALFIKIKPTIVNLLYAAVIFGGLAVGRNVWKMLFNSVFDLSDRVWRILAVRWGAWFVFLAILNEVIWRNFSEAFWANFKFWGVLPLTVLFAFANVPITLREQERRAAERKAASDETEES